MDRQRPRRVIISGGGTGGHIFPAISIANALKSADASVEILFVGAFGRMEMELVPAAGYRIEGLPVTGLRRKRVWANLKVIYDLFRSIRQAGKILDEFMPDAAVGVGGYASGPLLWVAARRKIPFLIQEQNSYAGITNRLLAGKAAVICVAYEGMEKYFPGEKIILSGNPVRTGFGSSDLLRAEALHYFGIDPGRKVVLVLGGSQGAGTINAALERSAAAVKESDAFFIWQAGRFYYEKVKETADGKALTNVRVMSFIDRMDFAYAAADVIVSRAGAGTISELCIAGRPVILVPSPNVVDDHQTKNANALTARNAAIMIHDNMAEELLVDEVLALLNDASRRESLSASIRKMAMPGASGIIANEVFRLMQ